MTSFASEYYIRNCATSELVELAFDAQRNLTSMIAGPEGTEAEYQAIKQYKATIKAEIVARVGVGYEPGMSSRMVLCDSYGKAL